MAKTYLELMPDEEGVNCVPVFFTEGNLESGGIAFVVRDGAGRWGCVSAYSGEVIEEYGGREGCRRDLKANIIRHQNGYRSGEIKRTFLAPLTKEEKESVARRWISGDFIPPDVMPGE